MSYARPVRRLLVPGMGLLLALTVAGCGGKDNDTTAHDSGDATGATSEPTSSDSTPSASNSSPSQSPEGGGLQVTNGISPDELMSCLTTAGLQATTDDSVPMGVSDPEQTIRVEQMQGYDGPGQGAYLYVFADPESAQKNAEIVTLGGTLSEPSNPRFAISGNVVRAFDIITGAKPTTDEANLLSCIPG
jgi:hypothetical protein